MRIKASWNIEIPKIKMSLNKTASFAFEHFFRSNFEPGFSRLALSLTLSKKLQEYLLRVGNAISKSYFCKFLFSDNDVIESTFRFVFG